MFENIHFTHSATKEPLTSKRITEQTYKNPKYDRENLSNSQFFICGSVDSFLRPPITDYAKEHLYYMQSFDIFYYNKDSFTRRANFHSYLILYTYEGEGLLEYEGKKYTLKPNDGFFIDCTKPHYYQAITDWKVSVLHFQGGFSSHMYDEYAKTGQICFHEPLNGRFHLYLEDLLTIYDSSSLQRDLRASHCLDGILLYLIMQNSSLAIQKNDVPRSIQSSMNYMENHYTEDISLDFLAELTKTNKYHLAKEFKKYTSFSPHDYLIRLRINQAKILLKSTSLPAVKIAHEVGIHDINNFNYLFKKREGMTPIQYRNSSSPLF